MMKVGRMLIIEGGEGGYNNRFRSNSVAIGVKESMVKYVLVKASEKTVQVEECIVIDEVKQSNNKGKNKENKDVNVQKGNGRSVSEDRVKYNREEWEKRVKCNISPKEKLMSKMKYLNVKIVQLNKSQHFNAKKKAEEMYKDSVKATGNEIKGLYDRFYDEVYRADLLVVKGLQWEKRKTEVDLMLLSKTPLTDDLRDICLYP
ncbi:hypothetical protein Tco_0025362 [Tanacetum coccineum]